MQTDDLAHLRAELARTRAELEAVSAVGQAVRAMRDLDALYPIIAAQLKLVMPLDALFISLYFAESASVRFVYQVDEDIIETTAEDWPLARAVLSRRVIEERTVVRIGDLLEGQASRNLTRFGTEKPTRAWMAAPMLAGDVVQGVISVQSYAPDLYDERHEHLLLLIATQIGVAVENARLVGQLRGTIQGLESDLSIEQERKARLEHELGLARRIQNEFLPLEMPDVPGTAIFTHTQPATEVGGDFYMVVKLADGRLAVVIGDVSGKGMPAALIMAAVCSLLPTLATLYHTPGAVLRALNLELYARLRRNRMNVALCYTLIAPDTGAILLANAGMPYPRARAAGHWHDVEAGNLPLGSLPNIDYAEHSLRCQPGDQLLLTSDGLVECRNALGELFGFERLHAALDTLEAASASQVLNRLRVTGREFSGARLDDDLTIVVVELL